MDWSEFWRMTPEEWREDQKWHSSAPVKSVAMNSPILSQKTPLGLLGIGIAPESVASARARRWISALRNRPTLN